MKKYLVLLVLVLTILALCACGQVPVVTTTTTGGGNTSSSSSSSSSNVTTLPAGVYAVHYELDGGEQSQFNPDKYVHGQDTPIYSPTKTGHIFDGWFLSSDFSGAAVTNLQDLEGEITLYAKWTVRQVRVTYDLGLASAINHPDNVSSFSWQADGKVPVFEPVANGYIFDGWYRDKNFTGEKVTELDASKTSAVKLYAKWIEAPSSMVTTAPTVLPNHSGLELTPGSKLLVDMSTLVTDKIAVTYPGGVHAEYVLKENGEAVVRWNDPATRQQLRVFNSAENADLSAYKGLTFMLYNANPHGGRFVFCVYSGGSAKVYLITLDWTGWKQVFIDFGSPDWSLVGGHNCTNVDAFAYLNNGWTANIVTVIKDETGKTIGYEYTSPEY
ncbi:MAG: InlB B-repeat-containing protein, partial [Clostridia bacterium]|nr:InlB B-repeat-containing protein [Clostridia bacterium]